MKKVFLISIVLFISACGTRVTWESSIYRGSLYYQSASDQKRLNNAFKNAIQKISSSDIPAEGTMAIVQVVQNDVSSRVVDGVYARLKKARTSLVKIKEPSMNKSQYDHILFVYPVVYGVKQFGTVFSKGVQIMGTGDRIAEVDIYARLVDGKKKQVVWEKTFDGTDDSIYAIYTFPVFDADEKKIDELVRRSQSGQ